MAIFNILGYQVSFDEDFTKYLEIYHKKENWISEYTIKYNSMQCDITTMNELIAYIENLKNFVVNEYNLIADKILSIFVDNQIFDKSRTSIISGNSSVPNFDNLILRINMQIKDYLNNINSQFEDVKRQTAIMAENSYDEYYVNVISSSAWDIIVNDTFNDIEATRVANKRQRLYDKEVSKAQKVFNNEINNTAQEFQKKFQELIYKGSLLIIDEMFIFCTSTLISNGKLSSSILDNLQKEKATNILNNLDRIQDIDTKKEQLIIALQSNPILQEIHSKLLAYINDDYIEEYIRLVKFLKCENILFNIILDNSLQGNEKYLQIIKALDCNNIYLKKLLNCINIDANSEISVNIESSKNLFGTLKIVFNDNIPIISQKEKSIFKAIVNKIEKKYNAIYNYDLENLDYKQLYDFLHDSRQLHTIKNLKKKRRSKRINLILGILFAIWILLLIVVGTPINEIITYGTIPFLVVYGIIRLIIWIIKKIYENIKNSENPQGTNNATVFIVIMFSIMLGIIIACCTM